MRTPVVSARETLSRAEVHVSKSSPNSLGGVATARASAARSAQTPSG
jgi:hypothetical protein